LKILELQEEGRNKMSAAEFVRGKANFVNTFFDGYGNK